MSHPQKSASVLDTISAIALTLLVTGLCYWLWQDVGAVLRPFKGQGWAFLRDLRILVNVLGLFLLVTVAGFVFDRSGAQSWTMRLVMAAALLLLAAGLARNGAFYKKEIEPALKAVGIESPAFLRPSQ